MVEVTGHGAALFVVVTKEEESTCLYSVDNMSGYVDVSVFQKGSPFGARHCALVATGECLPVALDCPDLPAILIIQPAMLDAMEVDLSQQGAKGVLPTRDGSDTFIHWVVALKGRRRVVVLTSRVGADALDEDNPLEWDAKLLVPGLGLSLVCDARAELLYARCSAPSLNIRNYRQHLQMSLQISALQVDNMTPHGPPTAFVSPAVLTGGGDAGSSASLPGATFLAVEAELSHQVLGLAYWKRVEVVLGPIRVQVQEEWLYALLLFEKETLFVDPASAVASGFSPDELGSVGDSGDGRGGTWDVQSGESTQDEHALRTLEFLSNNSDPGAFLELIRIDKVTCEASVYGLGIIARRPEGAPRGAGAEGGAVLGPIYSWLGTLGRAAPLPDVQGQTLVVEPLSVSEALLEDPADLGLCWCTCLCQWGRYSRIEECVELAPLGRSRHRLSRCLQTLGVTSCSDGPVDLPRCCLCVCVCARVCVESNQESPYPLRN